MVPHRARGGRLPEPTPGRHASRPEVPRGGDRQLGDEREEHQAVLCVQPDRRGCGLHVDAGGLHRWRRCPGGAGHVPLSVAARHDLAGEEVRDVLRVRARKHRDEGVVLELLPHRPEGCGVLPHRRHGNRAPCGHELTLLELRGALGRELGDREGESRQQGASALQLHNRQVVVPDRGHAGGLARFADEWRHRAGLVHRLARHLQTLAGTGLQLQRRVQREAKEGAYRAQR
mmetsp:Transcript_102889/g.297504  ORF Transcript_102889/g.297504 Transcript_102889/m.297504 type:complete len:231 (-) Transcript_102889:1115-1807(-)